MDKQLEVQKAVDRDYSVELSNKRVFSSASRGNSIFYESVANTSQFRGIYIFNNPKV